MNPRIKKFQNKNKEVVIELDSPEDAAVFFEWWANKGSYSLKKYAKSIVHHTSPKEKANV